MHKYFVCLFSFFFFLFCFLDLHFNIIQHATEVDSTITCSMLDCLVTVCAMHLCVAWSLCKLVFIQHFFKFAFTIWINSIQPKCRGRNFDLLNTCEWITVTCQCSIKQSLPRPDVLSTNIDHNKRLSHRIYWMVTANSLCVTTWRLVACTETGCGIDVEHLNVSSVVCNPGKVILLGRCTDFLGAQTHLGKKAKLVSFFQNASHELHFITKLCLKYKLYR